MYDCNLEDTVVTNQMTHRTVVVKSSCWLFNFSFPLVNLPKVEKSTLLIFSGRKLKILTYVNSLVNMWFNLFLDTKILLWRVS